MNLSRRVVSFVQVGFLVLLLAAASGSGQTKDPVRTWAPLLPTNGISGTAPLVSFAGRLLLLGNQGTLFSPDLTAAGPLRTLRSDNGYRGAARSADKLVAVFTRSIPPAGLTGPYLYQTSIHTTADGIRWTETTSFTRTFAAFQHIAYNGEKFVVALSDYALVSPDGVTWTVSSGTTQPATTPTLFRQMWYAESQRSTDARTWTNWSTPPPLPACHLVASETTLLAWNSSGAITVSGDAVTWSAAVNVAAQLDSVVAAAGVFYATTGTNSASYSTDGRTWQPLGGATVPFSASAVSHGGKVVALDAESRLWTGSGATWQLLIDQPAPSSATAKSHAAADGLTLYSFQQGAAYPLWLAANCAALRLVAPQPTAPVRGLAHDPAGRWVAVFSDGGIWLSSDGNDWFPRPGGPLDDELVTVAFANGRFVALGRTAIFVSVDGETWTENAANYTGLHAALGQFFAYRHEASTTDFRPSIFRSTDGLAWMPCTVAAPPPGSLSHLSRPTQAMALAESGGTAVLATGYETFGSASLPTSTGIFRTTDGVNWAFVTMAANSQPSLVAAGGRFVLATPSVYASADGLGWSRIATEPRTAIASDGETLSSIGQRFSVARLIAPRPGLSGLSTRGYVGSGDAAMIAGFVITGDRPRHTLLRASGGTTLGDYGVRGTLADPAIELVRIDGPSAGTIATNDNWNDAANAAELATVAHRLGEFPFPAGSTDAALALQLDPGVYTLVVRGHDGGTGVALAEVYDADAAPEDTSDRRIVALSTRLNVRTGDAVAISGLIVQGTRTKQMLLRGLGPELARLGVPNTVTKPRLSLFHVVDGVEQLVHTADAWADETNAPDLAIAFDECGVCALPVGAQDSALLVELAPGAYTIHLESRDGASGNGLIEAYEVR